MRSWKAHRGAVIVLLTASAFGQTPVPTSPASVPSQDVRASDPLAVGKSAMAHRQFAAAHSFFAEYVAANPGDMEGMFYLASSDLELRNYPAAIKECQAVIATKPNTWGAHQGLAFAYAQTGDWAAFDKERAFLKAARDRGAPGLAIESPDVIDRLTASDDTYTVFAFYKLNGHFHTRYFFIHFAPDGSHDKWFACESDDVDQANFAKQHPAEAAKGERSFSLDSYSVKILPSGQKSQTQGLIKFYWEGEPSYETVRADVLKALEGKSAPMSSTTVPKAGAPQR